MGKFNFSGLGKQAKDTAMVVLPITAGIIGSQKFFDFRTMLPKADPEAWYIKHQGAVKFAGAIVLPMMWKKMPQWMKYLMWGIAIQGCIQEVRQVTMNKEGKAFFDSIGAGEYDAAINEMANEIKKMATENISGPTPITDNSYSSVSGLGDNPSVNLMQNSQTAVSGIGWNDDEDRYAA